MTFHPVIYYLSGNYYDEDPEKRARAVYHHRHLETCLDRDLKKTIENRSKEVYEASSVRELAEKIGIDPARLQATVDEYNSFCRKGHDDLFAKAPKYLRPIQGPDFYAVRAKPCSWGIRPGKLGHLQNVVSCSISGKPGYSFFNRAAIASMSNMVFENAPMTAIP
jgi:hypothetical protein